MSSYSLSSSLRRGQEALERMERFLWDMNTTLLPPGVSPGAAGTIGRAGERRRLPPSPERWEPALLMANPQLQPCPRPLS